MVSALGFLGLLASCLPGPGTIGALLARNQLTGEVRVIETPQQLGADKAGLQPGDRILTIDGRDIRALSEAELYQALNGEVDSQVKLTVVRGEAIVRLTVTRTAAPKRRALPAG